MGVLYIVDKLDELGISDNTIIVYTSDNGPWIDPAKERTPKYCKSRNQSGTAYPLSGMKMTTWDGGSRVPCIIKYPQKIKSCKVSNEIVNATDFFPTLIAVANAELDKDRKIDGYDLSDFLFGSTDVSPRITHLFYKYTHLNAIRHGDWKLALPREKQPSDLGFYGQFQEEYHLYRLFNLRKDISESHNVAADNPNIVDSLLNIVSNVQQDLGDARVNIKGKGSRHIDSEKQLSK